MISINTISLSDRTCTFLLRYLTNLFDLAWVEVFGLGDGFGAGTGPEWAPSIFCFINLVLLSLHEVHKSQDGKT